MYADVYLDMKNGCVYHKFPVLIDDAQCDIVEKSPHEISSVLLLVSIAVSCHAQIHHQHRESFDFTMHV